MGVRIDATGVVYPDVTVSCDRRDLGGESDRQLTLSSPKVVFEALSPATVGDDRGYKTLVYKEISSIETIVLVDPVASRIEVHDRSGPDAWHHERLSVGAGLTLRDPAVALSFEEMFAAD